MNKFFISLCAAFVVGVSSISIFLAPPASAQSTTQNGEFSLQVSPSPLVATLKPGQTTELELKIRNSGLTTEQLRIDPRSFTLNENDESVSLSDIETPEAGKWVSFAKQQFTIQPGMWYTQKIRISLPENTGFSYSFALVISRQNPTPAVEGTRIIKGSVAVFTLLNVDKPGATRKLEVASLESAKNVYEYVPASFTIRLKNTGNTIIQPYGNVFIQQGGDSSTPLATLPVNEAKGYILPNAIRTLPAEWNDGFPRIERNKDGTTKEVWDWSQIGKLRIGHYSAKLVGVYNDGTRDVPIEGEVGFWILPWKIIGGGILILLLVFAGVWSIVRKAISIAKKRTRKP